MEKEYKEEREYRGYDDEDEIDLVEVAKTLWRGRGLIAAVMLAGLLLGLGWIYLPKPVYQSTALLSCNDMTRVNNTKTRLERLAVLEYDGDEGKAKSKVKLTNEKKTTFLEVAVTDGDPAVAHKECAALLGRYLQEEREKLQKEFDVTKKTLAEAKKQATERSAIMTADTNWQSAEETLYTNTLVTYRGQKENLELMEERLVVTPPSLPDKPVVKKKVKIIGIAVGVAFMLGCAVVLGRNFLQNLKSSEG